MENRLGLPLRTKRLFPARPALAATPTLVALLALALAAPLSAQSISLFERAVRGHSPSVSASESGSGGDIVVPAGTEFEVRLTQRLSSDDNEVGDRFTGILDTDIMHDGRVVIASGARLTGEVTEAGERKVNGDTKNVIAVRPVDMEVNGRRIPVNARVLRAVTKEDANRSTLGDVAIVGGGVAAGALLGGLLGNSTAATLAGAAAGGLAGTLIMVTTRDHEAVMPQDSRMTVRLEEALRIPEAMAARR
ncbi:MAG: hypothetical protein ACE5JR_12415 [Gemmatimonadota bacterium]